MGKPGPKQVPVTARIQKSTKGGIVQPSISGMGSIAKMKKAPMKKSLVGNQDQLPANLQASIKAAPGKTYGSPAKVVSRSRSGYKGITKKESQGSEALKNQKKYSRIQQEVAHMESAISNYQKKGGKANASDLSYLKKAKAKLAGAAGVGAKLATGNSGSSKKLTSNTNAGNAKSARGGFFGTDDYKKSVSAGNKETNSDKTRRDFTANLKNQSKPKAKAIKAIKAKSVKSVAKPKAKIETKLAAAPAKPTAKPTKKQVRKAKSVERKTERAAKARRKSVQALESGNLAKSRRLKRREARINKRIEKKKSGQASKAIEPK